MNNIIEEIDICPISAKSSFVAEVVDTGDRILDCVSLNTLRTYKIDNIGKQSVAVVYGNAECDLPQAWLSKCYNLVEYQGWYYIINSSNRVVMYLRIRADIINNNSNLVFYIDEKGNSMMVAGYLNGSKCVIPASLKDIRASADFTIVSTVRTLDVFNIDIKGVSSGRDKASIECIVDISEDADRKLADLSDKVNEIYDDYIEYDEYSDSVTLEELHNIVVERDTHFDGRLSRLLHNDMTHYLCAILTISSGVFSDTDRKLFDNLNITNDDIDRVSGMNFRSYKELCCNVSGLTTTCVSISKILDSFKYKDLLVVDKLYILCMNNTLPYSSITVDEEARIDVEKICSNMNFTKDTFKSIFSNVADADFDFISKFTLYDLAFCNLGIGYIPKILCNDMANLYANENKLLSYFNNEDMLDNTVDILFFWKDFYKNESKFINSKETISLMLDAFKGKNGLFKGQDSLRNFISIISSDIPSSLRVRLDKLAKSTSSSKLEFYDINTNTFSLFRWCRICEIILGLGISMRIDGVLTVDTITNTSLSSMTDMAISDYILRIKENSDVRLLIDKLLLF